jgi:hypothetical protein
MAGYELIGALNSNQQNGVTGQNIEVCEITFTAKKNFKLTDIGITISEICVVTPADLDDYSTVTGWTLRFAI